MAAVWFSRGDERCEACRRDVGEYLSLSRETGLRCLSCAGLDGLVWLPSGDPALTRRATALSSRHAVVMEWSRSRKRNERRGTLVEASALDQARASCAADATRREAGARKRRVRDAAADAAY